MNPWIAWYEGMPIVRTYPVPDCLPNVDDRFLVEPEDFIARIPAWWGAEKVESELAAFGLCLPVCAQGLINYAIGWNESGMWRDFVLAITSVTAGGNVVKSGARVTKSVAGFEIHKFVVGSRDALLFPLDYTLRVVPFGRRLEPVEVPKTEPAFSDLERRLLIDLKDRFDPTRKLNPGVWGFM